MNNLDHYVRNCQRAEVLEDALKKIAALRRSRTNEEIKTVKWCEDGGFRASQLVDAIEIAEKAIKE